MGWLPVGVDDRVAARAALAHDVDAPPLSAYRARPARRAERGGLMLGYAAYAPREIDEACARLAVALRGVRASEVRLIGPRALEPTERSSLRR
jgi:DNA-binding transcriptional MocR family regulator